MQCRRQRQMSPYASPRIWLVWQYHLLYGCVSCVAKSLAGRTLSASAQTVPPPSSSCNGAKTPSVPYDVVLDYFSYCKNNPVQLYLLWHRHQKLRERLRARLLRCCKAPHHYCSINSLLRIAPTSFFHYSTRSLRCLLQNKQKNLFNKFAKRLRTTLVLSLRLLL